MTATDPTPFGQTISSARLRQLEGTVAAASRGEAWAEIALGELSDREFDMFLRQRRALRLSDPAQAAADAKPKQARMPSYPAQLSKPGAIASGPGAVGGDPPPTNQVRGIARIAEALAASAAG